MKQIVRALEGEVSLEEGRKAGLIFSSASSSDHDQSSYSTDMRRFRRTALDSNDYVSSEFGHTSEYGLNPSSSSSEEMSQMTKSRTGSQRRSPWEFSKFQTSKTIENHFNIIKSRIV